VAPALSVSAPKAAVEIQNSGSILASGGAIGISLDATASQSIYNSGLITGGMTLTDGTGNVVLTNLGTIEGAIDVSNGTWLSNSGTITGSLSFQGVNQVNVQNHGTMNGIHVKGAAGSVFHNYNAIDGLVELIGVTTATNSGTISGPVATGSAAAFEFANTGTINGNVSLGNGANKFDSRRGAVNGTIIGGSGVDTIYLGNDGETVNGGAGHDVIYGGTGADTFAFTSFAAADYDRIFGFNVVNDTIQLHHTIFTKLTAGATPTFAIGSVATNASDHLFYNSTTGWLSYDPDGNGAQAAHGFVNLGAGLKLTASNFTVV
jgi:Ca2+-binding RTX toxin-like protein